MTTEYPKNDDAFALFFEANQALSNLRTSFISRETDYTIKSIERAEEKLYHTSYLYTSLARAIRQEILPRLEDSQKLLKYPFSIVNLGINHHRYLSQQITLFEQYRDIVMNDIIESISKQESCIYETNCREQDLEDLDELEDIINKTFDPSTLDLSFQGIIHRHELLTSSNNAYALILTLEEIEEANTNEIAHELSIGINRIKEIKQNRKDAGMRN